MEILKIRKIHPDAIVPAKATSGSACFDLYVILDSPFILMPHERNLFHTGLSIEMPSEDCVCLLFSRSGMGIKHGISLSNSVGVIDSDYRGELCVGLINNSDEPYTIQPNDRIAQMMIMKTTSVTIEVVDELNQTERGEGGFGSTGNNI
ncbi:MAG: dUTP diphosphatase [Oscillospiraceae bacterium]|nr:dUTP diphosphatase [Oscillospiraceae bacterium]